MSRKATAYPDYWLEKKLGDVCLIEIGGTPSRNNPNFWAENEEGYPWVAISDLSSKLVYHTAEQITRSGVTSSNAKLVPKGTVLMSFKLTLGRVGIAGVDLYTNEAIAAFFPRSFDVFNGWLYHVLPSIAQSVSAEQAIKGQTLNKDKLERLYFRLPPLPEQRRIAEILDTVDEAIARTESLIAKLKQMKAGLLHDLLTRGLDENGQLRDVIAHPEQFKDSLLGPIPKKWEAKPLAAIADLQVGYAFKSEWFQKYEGIRLLRGENVGYGSPDWSETRTLPWNMYPIYREYELGTGDIIIGMDRTFTKTGFKISVLECKDVPALLVQRVGRFLPIGCDQQFLKDLLNSPQYHGALLAQQKGMDIPHLSKSEILEPLVSVPPLEEQSRIAAIIDAHDTRIRTEEAYLDKLKLQKKGLMHDLLTGKVRVNNKVTTQAEKVLL